MAREMIVARKGADEDAPAEAGRVLSAPTMQLMGHGASVTALAFSRDGRVLCSCSADGRAMLWRPRGDCTNLATLPVYHTAAILDCCFSGAEEAWFFTAGADKVVAVQDCETERGLRKLFGHKNVVNAIVANLAGPEVVVSGSDDCTSVVWDLRAEQSNVHVLPHPYPVVGVSCGNESTYMAASTSSGGANIALKIFTGSVDNTVRMWDTRNTREPVFQLAAGHSDVITSLCMSPLGVVPPILLSNGLDGVLCLWDVSPFVPAAVTNENARLLASIPSTHQNLDSVVMRGSFSRDGAYFGCGALDRTVCIWKTDNVISSARGRGRSRNTTVSVEPIYKLPEHKGTITDVKFHPFESIVASASLDKTIFIGELDLS